MADEKLRIKSDDDPYKDVKPYDPDEVTTFIYDIKKPMEFINEGKNGVFDITKQTGINSAKSVFDKYSTFRT